MAQCLLGDDKKRLSTRAIVKAGVVSEVWVDTTGDQYADTRQILSDGRLVRVDADTNNDHKPDVVQTYDGDALRHQDEDTNGDGVVDQRFAGEKAVPVPPGTRSRARRSRGSTAAARRLLVEEVVRPLRVIAVTL